jgi:hypothetical protein
MPHNKLMFAILVAIGHKSIVKGIEIFWFWWKEEILRKISYIYSNSHSGRRHIYEQKEKMRKCMY